MAQGPAADGVVERAALIAPRDPVTVLVRRYAVGIAVVTVLLGVAVAATSTNGWFLAAALPACPFLAACTVIDAHVHRIPTPLVWTAGGLGLVLLAVAADATGWASFGRAVAAGAVVGAVFWAKWWLTGGQTGMGDVRLATVLALYAGFLGWTTVLACVAVAYFLVFPVAVYRLIRGVQSPIPFGPALVAGWCVALGLTLLG